MKIQMKILNKEFYSYMSVNGTGNKGKYDLPCYATPGSAAMDLACTKDVTIYPGDVVAIPTGLAIWIGYHGTWEQGNPVPNTIGRHFMGIIAPRSGLGTQGLVLANTIGIIDEDYQGELIVQAWNRKGVEVWKSETGTLREERNIIELKAGERFAQLMFVPVIKAQWDIVEEFSHDTKRGQGGFGSTGK